MAGMREPAYAKLNLTLDVGKKREDGYHDLTMVMISLDLCDDVEMIPGSGGTYTLSSNRKYLPTDGRNHAVKAAAAFYARLGQPGGGEIRLTKRIPVGAGMAGGSADAAAVLRLLNRFHGDRFSAEELCEIGLSVGSDVPYCVRGGTALARGRGELLSPLPELPPCGILVCKPAFSISTGELFARIGARREKTRPDTTGIVAALEAGDLDGIAKRMFNVFEDVLPRQYSEVEGIRARMLESGALGSVMTGTGSAVFGLFREEELLRDAFETLRRTYRECFIARSVGRIL